MNNKPYCGFTEGDHVIFYKDGIKYHSIVKQQCNDLFQLMIEVEDAEAWNGKTWTIPADICKYACSQCDGYGKITTVDSNIESEVEYPCLQCKGTGE